MLTLNCRRHLRPGQRAAGRRVSAAQPLQQPAARGGPPAAGAARTSKYFYGPSNIFSSASTG